MTDNNTNDAVELQGGGGAVAADALTEDAAALAFVSKRGDDIKYCHSTRSWFCWDGSRWQQDKKGLTFQLARELTRETSLLLNSRSRVVAGRAAFVSGLEKFAKTDQAVSVTIDHWDANPYFLGTPTGTVDLQNGELRAARREDAITKVTAVGPSSKGCPRWMAFLYEATGGDAELIRFLQQWCGYCLTGVTREHALVFIHGLGGNGKRVFLNVVCFILHEYASSAAMDTFTASRSDKHPTELAMLRGARLVTASETEEGRSWAEARIKQMTGGDRITARFMRQNFFAYSPQFKLIIAGNHKPILRNIDEAARRRFLIVPFNRQPAVPDQQLEEKLKGEREGILRWMIDGCLDWQENGLIKPSIVRSATDEYFSDQDVFAHWLAERCVCEIGNAEKSEASSRLFKSWKEYAFDAGYRPGSLQSFRDTMLRHGFKFRRNRSAREFFGIALLTDMPPHESDH
jgi:putative DNA primase/helicase